MANIRLRVVFTFFFIIFILLSVRLFYWQVVRGKELSDDAKNQYQSDMVLAAPRGNILANDNTALAVRRQMWLIYAFLPDLKESPEKVANKLAPFFVEDAEGHEALLSEAMRLTGLLSRKDTSWVPLKHRVANEIKNNISALAISGIGFEEQEVRSYPEGSIAAQLLGFVGKDKEGADVGYFGLEGYYDLILSGKSGFVGREKDARGRPILIGTGSEVSAIGGVDLVTHIDKTVQLVLEKKLLDGIERYGAKGGTAIVMKPATGAILGMASYPSYDPEKYWEFGNDYFKNPAVSDVFEPGSVFKIIVMAAALDAGVVTPDMVCDICSGPLHVDKYLIETWNKKYYPDSTMTDVIVHSDNVGMSFVGQKLGAEKLYDYLDKFGIGKTTGIDLQGEARGELREKRTWNIVDVATASFGQGVAVTPIQMLRAAAVIANGGRLVTPQIVGKEAGEGWEEEIKPQVGSRAISEKAAKEITAMMVLAAKNGESKWTDVPGFGVAGKTGTAQIPIAGHYDATKTIASFVGFAPASNPKFIMIVTLKEPASSQWASETAAPLWYSIFKELIPYFGVQPEG
jgi:cell division protein FtsI/penicillin-binding protein 2